MPIPGFWTTVFFRNWPASRTSFAPGECNWLCPSIWVVRRPREVWILLIRWIHGWPNGGRPRSDRIYQQIPDFGGFVVKADSEGRAGPSSYGRTPADAANVIARALRSHGGMLFYRAFVYDHHLDWRNPKNDRARAAYDIFHPLDGKFDDNVIIQIKYGPIDFQAREPVSPLFGGLEKTNQGIELQITQEYTGQQRHLCFLPPMWKEVLDFDLRVNGGRTPVKDLVAGKTFRRPSGPSSESRTSAWTRTGSGTRWPWPTCTDLAGWPGIQICSAESIAEEWTRLTFGNDPTVVKTDLEPANEILARV